jgi:hypothetical protein
MRTTPPSVRERLLSTDCGRSLSSALAFRPAAAPDALDWLQDKWLQCSHRMQSLDAIRSVESDDDLSHAHQRIRMPPCAH